MASTALMFMGILALSHVIIFGEAGGGAIFLDDLKVHQSKPPVKIIETQDGDVIDCIEFYDQPAFRDPVLRKMYQNKKEPSFLKKAAEADSTTSHNKHEGIYAWRKDGGCPKETVPIWRCNKNFTCMAPQRRRTSSTHAFYPNATRSNADPPRIHEYATFRSYGNYRGLKARISIWQPKVEDGDFSLAQIWAIGGGPNEQDTVEAGWQVYPPKHGGDKRPHFFLFMTNDSYNSNNYYDGYGDSFIVSKDTPLPLRSPLVASTVNGAQKDHGFALEMSSDGDWILKVDGDVVGHWPHYTLPRLSKGAKLVQWGGEVYITKQKPHSITEMGSGIFPREGVGKAAYFGRVAMIKGGSTRGSASYVAPERNSLLRQVTDPNCYEGLDVGPHGNLGYTFYYGGSGGADSRCKGKA